MSKSLRNRRFVSMSALGSIFAVAVASAGCSNAPDESVTPRVEVINRTRSALSSASITAIDGTYSATCDGHEAGNGADTWTYDAGAPGNTTLSVRKNDDDCVLSITHVHAGDAFTGTPAIALDTTNAYRSTASAFALAAPGSPTAFYGNAKISALTFAANFTITLLVSDQTNASDEGDKNADFATQSATVSASTVAASDYTLDMAEFGVVKDAKNVVQSASGFAALGEQAVLAQGYAVHVGALTGASTIDEVEAAYAASTASGSLSSLADALQLPASMFALADVDLDTSPQRTVILRNTVSGVSSYQLLLITFKP
jgi:hypothetical protein